MSGPVIESGLADRDGQALVCQVCPHECRLAEGQFGVCGVRRNAGGGLRLVTLGRIVAASLDPIEKKPLRHFRPGSRVYTVAMPGCTLACRFCQNWEIALTAADMHLDALPCHTPEGIVAAALELGADGIGFGYTEPVAGLEFAVDVMRCARAAGLFSVWHTNGYMTPRSLAAVAGWLDAACIDLKAATDDAYRRLTGGTLAPVLAAARALQAEGVWVEMSTPLLAGLNDSDESVFTMARLIVESLGPATPWHLLRGHAAHRMLGLPLTPSSVLDRAADLARASGLRWVSAYP